MFFFICYAIKRYRDNKLSDLLVTWLCLRGVYIFDFQNNYLREIETVFENTEVNEWEVQDGLDSKETVVKKSANTFLFSW